MIYFNIKIVKYYKSVVLQFTLDLHKRLFYLGSPSLHPIVSFAALLTLCSFDLGEASYNFVLETAVTKTQVVKDSAFEREIVFPVDNIFSYAIFLNQKLLK